jgi:hypothetical protein
MANHLKSGGREYLLSAEKDRVLTDLMLLKRAIETVTDTKLKEKGRKGMTPYARMIFLKIVDEKYPGKISQTELFATFLGNGNRCTYQRGIKSISDRIETDTDTRLTYMECLSFFEALKKENEYNEPTDLEPTLRLLINKIKNPITLEKIFTLLRVRKFEITK